MKRHQSVHLRSVHFVVSYTFNIAMSFLLKIILLYLIFIKKNQGKHSSFHHLTSNIKCLIYFKLII